MKNPNSYGTIVKLPGKRRKPFAVRITTGWHQEYDDDGIPVGKPKQLKQYIGYYATRKEAISALSVHNTTRDGEVATPATDRAVRAQNEPVRPTFGEIWNEIRKMKKVQWSISTLRNYDSCFTRCKSIENRRIDLITYPELQRLMNSCMKEGKTAGSLKLFKVFMTLVFGEAVKMQYIVSSPVQYVTYKATAEKRVKKALPDSVLQTIAKSDCRTRDLCLILAYTGMRIGELLDLREENIHLEDHYMVAGSKTKAGTGRTIPIHPVVAEILPRWMEAPKVGYTRLTGLLREDCTEYGMSFSFHELRHTFITNANRYDMDLYCLKEIVGHSRGDVTEDVYTHIPPEKLYAQICLIPSVV